MKHYHNKNNNFQILFEIRQYLTFKLMIKLVCVYIQI